MADMRYITIPEPVVCRDLNKRGKPPIRINDPSWTPPPADEVKCLKCDGEGVAYAPIIEDDPWTLERLLTAWVFCLEDWTKKGIKKARMANKVLDALEDAKPGERVGIPTDAWRAIKETLESDSFEIKWPFSVQLAGLCDLLIDASDKAVVEAPSQPLEATEHDD